MDQDPSFTQPHRRSQAPHEFSPATSAQAPWTATRCNRLLRPISSRIALLRKGGNREACNTKAGSDEAAKRRSPRRFGGFMSSKSFAFARTETHDPDWAPVPRPLKRVKRTYSAKQGNQNSTYVAGRGSMHDPERGSDTSLEIPATAILGDVENKCCLLPDTVEVCLDDCTKTDVLGSELKKDRLVAGRRISHVQPRETLRQLARSVSPAHWMLVDGLYSGFDALLKATSRSTGIHKSGTRSLLLTCLRVIPEYIDEEQSLCDEENPDGNISISSIIYAELETFGHSHVGGWKPLREVARAHGVAMLGTAIEEESVTFSTARGLVILCLHGGAYDEAQYIVQSMVKSMEIRLVSRASSWHLSEEKMRATLGILDHFATTTGRSGFQYSMLASMLSRGILSMGWISSPASIKHWNAVIREVSQQGLHAQEAGLLLRTAALLSYHGQTLCMTLSIHVLRLHSREQFGYALDTREVAKPVFSQVGATNKGPGHTTTEKDSCTTISNLLTVLSSICILNGTESVSIIPQQPTLSTLRDIAQEAQKASEVSALGSGEGLLEREKSELIAIAMLAAALAKVTISNDYLDSAIQLSIDVGAMAHLVNRNDDIPDYLGSFINAIAQCCARATSDDPLKHLQVLIRHLSEFAKIGAIDLAVRQLCAQSALAAAFQYSENTGESRHLEWALEVQQSVKKFFGESTHRCAEQTPTQSSKNKNGYRWEEGICEWVTKTPGTLWPQLNRQKECQPADSSKDEIFAERSYSPTSPQNIRLSEISPCFPAKSVRFRIQQQRRRRYSTPDAALDELSRELPAFNVHKPCRRVSDGSQNIKGSRRRMFHSIHLDEDVDELSPPDSSQANASTTNKRLREVRNITVKPRRQVQHASKLCRSTSTSSDTAGATSFKTEQDMIATESYSEDELGV